MDLELRISGEAERCIEEQLQWYEAEKGGTGKCARTELRGSQ